MLFTMCHELTDKIGIPNGLIPFISVSRGSTVLSIWDFLPYTLRKM